MTGYSAPDDNIVVKLARGFSKHLPIIMQILGTIFITVAAAFISDWSKLPTFTEANAATAQLETLTKDQANSTTTSKSEDSAHTKLSLPWVSVPGGLASGFLMLGYGMFASSKDKETLLQRAKTAEKDLNTLKSQVAGDNAKLKYLNEELKSHTASNYQLVSEVYDEYRAQISLWLTMLSQELEFGENHRITIYYLDEMQDNFLPLERYSKGPVHNQTGRLDLEIGNCAISQAWKNGHFFCDDIPDHINQAKRYCHYLRTKFSYSNEIIERLTMHSRSIGAYAVDDQNGHHVGVVVYESMGQDLNEALLVRLSQRENSRVLHFIQETQRRDVALANFRDRSGKEGGTEDVETA